MKGYDPFSVIGNEKTNPRKEAISNGVRR